MMRYVGMRAHLPARAGVGTGPPGREVRASPGLEWVGYLARYPSSSRSPVAGVVGDAAREAVSALWRGLRMPGINIG